MYGFQQQQMSSLSLHSRGGGGQHHHQQQPLQQRRKRGEAAHTQIQAQAAAAAAAAAIAASYGVVTAASSATARDDDVETDAEGFVVVVNRKTKKRAGKVTSQPLGLAPLDESADGSELRYIVDEFALVEYLHEYLHAMQRESPGVTAVDLEAVLAAHPAGADSRFYSQLKQEVGARESERERERESERGFCCWAVRAVARHDTYLLHNSSFLFSC
tara:strand:+ start:458 stop:1105 length:648 start_codon:yes stop_codon:yes gene_type:complete